jgi:hypothetical protein
VADCVNPVAASREGWRAVATRAAVRLIARRCVAARVLATAREIVVFPVPGRPANTISMAQALAGANLGEGRVVVADCVNPVAASREGWRAVATQGRAIDDETRPVPRLVVEAQNHVPRG